MFHILFKCVLVTIVATACSVVLTGAIRAVSHAPDSLSQFIAIICPLLIAPPLSFMIFRQSERLRQALAELNRVMQELEVTNAKLFEKSSRDSMTGLYNRETFFGQVEMLRRQRPGSLLIIDADHFKKINDTHGHPTGDAALLAITQCITRCVGANDTVGRVGGEEFGVFLASDDEKVVNAVAEIIRTEINEHEFISPSGAHVPLSVSIGGVAGVADGTVADHFQTADRRLYEAKRRGRNCVCIQSGIKRTV